MSWLRTTFSMELRSLAFFRMALGCLLLLDLALRALDMGTFYTDDGVLARRFWVQLTHPWHWSLHVASGELWWQILLFALAAALAVGLTLGYRSRLMAIGSFLMLASLMNRNPLLLQGGDQLLVILCFWSIFLPLGARLSVDSALQPHYRHDPNQHRFAADQAQPYFSMATIAVTFQILYLYSFTAMMKTGDAWTTTFDAAFYAVSLQHFATPIGDWMRHFPLLLKFGTIYVLAIEVFAPILVLLCAWWMGFRLIGLALLASLHLAFLLMLHIGLFPLIDFAALSLLLPSTFWLWWYRHQNAEPPSRASNIVIYYDEDCGFCLKMVLILREFLLPQAVPIIPAQRQSEILAIMDAENSWVITDAEGKPYIHWHAMAFLFCQRWPFKPLGWLMKLPPLMALGNQVYKAVADNRGLMSDISANVLKWQPISLRPTIIGSGLAVLFLIVITAFNVYELPHNRGNMPAPIERIARLTRLEQRWDMFAPYPLTVSIYPRVPGILRNGDAVDLYEQSSSAPDWQPPQRMYGLYSSYRWRKYMGRVDSSSSNAVRQGYGDYLCRQWNHRTRPIEQQLATLQVFFIKLTTTSNQSPKPVKERRVWRHWCYDEFAP